MTRTALPTAVDVVIIGGGISEVVCAAETARRGATTLLLEKAPHLGLAIAPAAGRILADLALTGDTRYPVTPSRLVRLRAGPVMPRRIA